MKELKYLFCNIAWMENYKGITDDDRPLGGGRYVDVKGTGGEICNFSPDEENQLLGYVQPQGRGGYNERKINIEKIVGGSGDKKQESEKGVFVIWTAPFHKNSRYIRKKRVVVGWYKNATVYRKFQKFGTEKSVSALHQKNNIGGYWIQAEGMHLLPVHERDSPKFLVNREGIDWKGRNLICFGDTEMGKDFALSIWKLAQESPGAANKNSLRGFADYEHKLKVENAAIEKAKEYYGNKVRGCEVVSVETENKGWDLEVKPNKNSSPILFVEVKGLSGSAPTVELTPNEFSAFKKESSDYRLAIVVNALTNPTLLECYFDNDSNNWKVNNLDKKVSVKERISAKIEISDGV